MKETFAAIIDAIRDSTILRGAVSTLAFFLILLCILFILTCVSYTLRRYFRRHEGIKRVHRLFIYLMTMTGVVVLLTGGLLGLVFPFIPGVFLILAALLLLRRYHRSQWIDHKISYLELKLKFKKGYGKVKTNVKKKTNRMRTNIKNRVRKVKKNVSQSQKQVGKALRRKRAAKRKQGR
jgi:hypothetical protein